MTPSRGDPQQAERVTPLYGRSPAIRAEDWNRISVGASDDWIKRVTRAAANAGVSRSALIRQAVQTYLEERDAWTMRGPMRQPKSSKYESQRRKPKLNIEGRKTDERLVR